MIISKRESAEGVPAVRNRQLASLPYPSNHPSPPDPEGLAVLPLYHLEMMLKL
jgi:hypothetical protein